MTRLICFGGPGKISHVGLLKTIIGAGLLAALAFGAAERGFASFADVKAVLDAHRNQLPSELKDADEAKWTAWSRQQDKAIRGRLRQGELDSMVNLLLFGTSFTREPRVRIEDITEAAKSGVVRARVDDLVAGLRNPAGNERLIFLNGLLKGIGVNPEAGGPETGVFIYNNLLRVLKEDQSIRQRAAEAVRETQKTGDPASLLDRSSLFRDRGVSLDTSILPDFLIEQTLRDLTQKGVLREGQVARVAVVGPGLDFIDKNQESGYDYYPQQTVQPFAVYDSLVRLGLAKTAAAPDGLSVSVFDISSRVIDHLQRARARAMKDVGYVIQLPRDISRPWSPALVAYWRAFGDHAGAEVAPIRPPEVFQAINSGKGLETRAVQIRPGVVLACQPSDLNIVLERLNLAPADRFDLIIGTNIFVYYDAFEQALALQNAGAMLKPGGLLLTNDRLPELSGGPIRLAGMTTVIYDEHDPTARGAVGWYRKQ